MDVETVQDWGLRKNSKPNFQYELSSAAGKCKVGNQRKRNSIRGLALIPTFPQASAITAVFI